MYLRYNLDIKEERENREHELNDVPLKFYKSPKKTWRLLKKKIYVTIFSSLSQGNFIPPPFDMRLE